MTCIAHDVRLPNPITGIVEAVADGFGLDHSKAPNTSNVIYGYQKAKVTSTRKRDSECGQKAVSNTPDYFTVSRERTRPLPLSLVNISDVYRRGVLTGAHNDQKWRQLARSTVTRIATRSV